MWFQNKKDGGGRTQKVRWAEKSSPTAQERSHPDARRHRRMWMELAKKRQRDWADKMARAKS